MGWPYGQIKFAKDDKFDLLRGIFGHGSGIKIRAAKKMMLHLDKEVVKFENDEIEALKQGNLGKIYKTIPKSLKLVNNIFTADFFVTQKI